MYTLIKFNSSFIQLVLLYFSNFKINVIFNIKDEFALSKLLNSSSEYIE